MIHKQVAEHRAFFRDGQTKSIDFRIKQLKKLDKAIETYSEDIMNALYQDFRKPRFESFTTEIYSVREEIKLAIRHLRKWAKPKRVRTPLMLFKASGHIYYDPYGVVLVIGAWNYPFQVVMNPLIGAIAAGNCVVVKPSELSSKTADVVEKVIKQCFDEAYVSVVKGGIPETTELLKERFDLIMFTGSPKVGRIVAKAAAVHMTPTILELGGKSPCIIDKGTDLTLASKRIIWGKFMNAGQTCVAPDYLYVHQDIKEAFVGVFKETLHSFYGDNIKASDDYARIINETNFDRVSGYLKDGKILLGGEIDPEERYIEPTLLGGVTWEHPVMSEEIFGPILPIMSYMDLDAVLSQINSKEKPLALYYFSKDRASIKKVLSETTSGGMCINGTVQHCANPNLPLGGVGNSGMGNYHGHASFLAFSHHKSVMNKSTLVESSMLYAPYNARLKTIRRLVGM